MSFPYQIQKARSADVVDMATCFFKAFVEMPHPQAQFYGRMFPSTPSVHDFFVKSLATQMQQEPQSVFLKAVEDSCNGNLVGFIKWASPEAGESYWADYREDSDARLCNAFFGAMGENREKLMGNRPHWC